MLVLFIDGPAKGDVRDVDLGSSRVLELPVQSRIELKVSIGGSTVRYNLHRMYLLGCLLNIMSVQLTPDSIDNESAFDLIASPKAKMVSRRADG